MEPIAVVGLAIHLPDGIKDAEHFWQVIQQGRQLKSKIPDDRININAFYHPNTERNDTMNVREGHFISDDPAVFDAQFFSIHRAEAISMDPQQRMLLETSYRALENAGVSIEAISGSRTGVFMAASSRDFEVMLNRDVEYAPKYMGTGIGSSLLANRISWFFNCQGPSMAIDTACSGGLTAIHLACQSLRSQETTMALAGGVNLILSPEISMGQLSSLGFLSPDGTSYSFDSRANGYGKGEGLSVIVLKRVSDAIKNNDTIRAVIRATSVNQDGRTPGITQPSRQAQTDNIVRSYKLSGLSLDDTTYFEAHGTGTAVGDPIEAAAVNAAFQRGRAPENPLYIGSLKANIGHLESGAGVAAFAKAVLMLEKGIMPPNANFQQINPAIPAQEWNMKFLKAPTPFPESRLRRVSINSFGYGGTNAHTIVDDAQSFLKAFQFDSEQEIHNIDSRTNGNIANGVVVDSVVADGAVANTTVANTVVVNGVKANTTAANTVVVNGVKANHVHDKDTDASLSKPTEDRPTAIYWSAADKTGVRRIADSLSQYLHRIRSLDGMNGPTLLARIAYTLNKRRSALAWRAYTVVHDLEELETSLSAHDTEPIQASLATSIAFAFTGQGAQWYGMADGLFCWPEFRTSLEASDAYLKEIGASWSLLNKLYYNNDPSSIHSPEYSQPLCTALQIGVVDLFKSWGIVPLSALGHSSGEIAAAYCAGALSHRSAIQVAFWRGYLVARALGKKIEPGAMLAVALSESEIQPLVRRVCHETGCHVSVGCINSPKSVTATGNIKGIERLRADLEQQHIFARRLKVDVAYHSDHMQQVAAEYIQRLSATTPSESESSTQLFSSVDGSIKDNSGFCDGEYWAQNLVNPVRFSQALEAMVRWLVAYRKENQQKVVGKTIIVEIGPHNALQRAIKDVIQQTGAIDIESDFTLSRSIPPATGLAAIAARLKCQGTNIDLELVNHSEEREERQIDVNLPGYEFNHSNQYWAEPRVSRVFRHRAYIRHELLGVQDSDWNPLQPKWRHVVRRSEHNWIEDHKISGVCLYPAAGFLVMAIEAARQLIDDQERIEDYVVNNARFLSSVPMSADAASTEMQIILRPHDTGANGSIIGHDFTIYSLSEDTWREACYGSIQVILSPEGQNGTNVQRLRSMARGLTNPISQMPKKVSVKQLYSHLSTAGFGFGPSFQGIKSFGFDPESARAAATVRFPCWNDQTGNYQIAPHVIHPAHLDAVFHTCLGIQSQGTQRSLPVLVPTQLRKLRVSGNCISPRQDSELQVSLTKSFSGFRESDFDIKAQCPERNLSITVEGYRIVEIELKSQQDITKQLLKRNYYHISWKPDIDLLEAHSGLIGVEQDFQESAIGLLDRLELLCQYYLHQVANEANEIPGNLPSHLKRYYHWLRAQCSEERLEKLRTNSPDSALLFGSDSQKQTFTANLASEYPGIEDIVKVGESLPKMLRGESNTSDAFLSGDNLLDFYDAADNASLSKIMPYIELSAHKNPAMKVLEIGGGMGSTTKRICQTFLSYNNRPDVFEDISRLSEYVFTESSSEVVDAARKNLRLYQHIMKFQTLDIEGDLGKQGYQVDAYDMIIVSDVLHRTSNVKRALENVKDLLRPGGKLVFHKSALPVAISQTFCLGLAPGWWIGTEPQEETFPLLSQKDLRSCLQELGFTIIEASASKAGDPAGEDCSWLIASVPRPVEPYKDITIFFSEQSASHTKIAQDLVALLASVGTKTHTTSLTRASIQSFEHRSCIVLEDLENSTLREVAPEVWTKLSQVIRSAASILWVSMKISKSKDADLGLVSGLGRNINSENGGTKFVELCLTSEFMTTESAKQILRVLNYRSVQGAPSAESEFKEISGKLCVPRVIEAPGVTSRMHQLNSMRYASLEPFGSGEDRALAMSIASPGLLDTLEFDDDSSRFNPLKDTEVEVKTEAVGLNFKDTIIALGQLASDNIGFECAGVVNRVGPNSNFKVGDRVCCCTTKGAYKTFVRAESSATMLIPKSLSMAESAGIPIVFYTAYYALVLKAQLQRGETVLIHSGAGGLGQAAIQIAQSVGAEVFATVGTEEKVRLLQDRYGISRDRIFNSRDTVFAEKIMEITKSGVDVILNSLSGKGQTVSWDCIAPLGRFLEVGKKDIESGKKKLSMTPFRHSVDFSSIDLAVVMTRSKRIMQMITDGVSKLFNGSGALNAAQPTHTFPISKIEAAFRFMQSGTHSGKIVVTVDQNDLVPTLPSIQPTYFFSESATYLLAGGLGGLGRSIIRWMASRGARYFLCLSRSGADGNESSKTFLADMRHEGIQIEAPKCDITEKTQVSECLSKYDGSLPPIRGCIQAAMVLKDGLFESMSSDDFNKAVRPKSLGTENLANAIRQDLDFFVILSSISGVTGARAQANYAAGNAFQDEFARVFTSQGRRCISLNLGPVLSVGRAAEQDLTAALRRDGYEGMDETEVLQLLDYCCDPACPIARDPEKSQLVTGLVGAQTLEAEHFKSLYWTSKPMFSLLLRLAAVQARARGVDDEGSGQASVAALAAAAETEEELTKILVEALGDRFSTLLGLNRSDFNSKQSIMALGIDSLVALELRYWLAREVSVEMSVLEILNAKNTDDLAAKVAAKKTKASPETQNQ